MEEVISFLRTDNFLLFITVIITLIFITMIALLINTIKLNKRYKKFIKKLSKGNNIEEDLKNYISKVENIEKQNNEIIQFCENLNNKISKCIQKIGIVRYNAFKDTGSDLSFALAMLDDKNNGIVLNGIYSREMSNIYAKPIINGASEYKLSEEESEAIQKAIDADGLYKIM